MGAQSKLMLLGPPWVAELAAALGVYMGVFVTGAVVLRRSNNRYISPTTQTRNC